MHTLKSNKLVLAIDNSEITNREISQNQDTHGLLRLKTKTSFRHLIKYITYKNSTERESEFRVVMSWNIIHAVAKNQIKNISYQAAVKMFISFLSLASMYIGTLHEEINYKIRNQKLFFGNKQISV